MVDKRICSTIHFTSVFRYLKCFYQTLSCLVLLNSCRIIQLVLYCPLNRAKTHIFIMIIMMYPRAWHSCSAVLVHTLSHTILLSSNPRHVQICSSSDCRVTEVNKPSCNTNLARYKPQSKQTGHLLPKQFPFHSPKTLDNTKLQ